VYSPQRYNIVSLWRRATLEDHDNIYLATRRDGSTCLLKVDTFSRNKSPIKESLEFRTIRMLQSKGGGEETILKVIQFFEVEHISRQVAVFAGVMVTEKANLDFAHYARTWGKPLPLPVIRKYMSDMLRALAYCHEYGVIHGNVNPNAVFVRKSGFTKEKISDEYDDFKLAGFERSHLVGDMKRNVTQNTRMQFRAPEMLLRLHNQYDPMLFGTAVDIWSLGCMLAGSLMHKDPFFDDEHATPPVQLTFYLKLLGTPTRDELRRGTLPSDFQAYIITNYPSYANVFDGFFSSTKYPSDAIDLLKRMLVIEPSHRVTAKDALTHPFFGEIY
jgi:serine/threonine protein kinase